VDQQQLTSEIAGRAADRQLFAPSPLLEACAGWPVGVATASVAPVFPLQVPALVMRGEYDPLSVPLDDLRQMMPGPTAFLIDVPNQSANAMGFTPCPRDIRDAWIDAPLLPPPDRACLAAIPPVDLGAAR
jgi:hypothetical protein